MVRITIVNTERKARIQGMLRWDRSADSGGETVVNGEGIVNNDVQGSDLKCFVFEQSKNWVEQIEGRREIISDMNFRSL